LAAWQEITAINQVKMAISPDNEQESSYKSGLFPDRPEQVMACYIEG
jgi:hypothetical protein